ncbi:hypothetical protein EVAR_97454_1 [Eumeta japonica]|uniref:Uncharacterized protein n=1 Tax=Eumeta variegata TaxID=151549 RepID=A0A4C1WYP0_EUMVA|nr:hypothetical protein EVAR_97454_1 [Eumeta japonica]
MIKFLVTYRIRPATTQVVRGRAGTPRRRSFTIDNKDVTTPEPASAALRPRRVTCWPLGRRGRPSSAAVSASHARHVATPKLKRALETARSRLRRRKARHTQNADNINTIAIANISLSRGSFKSFDRGATMKPRDDVHGRPARETI